MRFDGTILRSARVAGGGRMVMNHRFVCTNDAAGQEFETQDKAADRFPFSYAETTDHITGRTDALLRHPEQLAKLQADPSLLDGAVEELLRYDSPVQVTSRVPLEDVEIQGVRIPKGDEVNTLMRPILLDLYLHASWLAE